MRKNVTITEDCSASKKAVSPIGPENQVGISGRLLLNTLHQRPSGLMVFTSTPVLCEQDHHFTSVRPFTYGYTLYKTMMTNAALLVLLLLNYRGAFKKKAIAFAGQGWVPGMLRVSVWGGRPPVNRIYHL